MQLLWACLGWLGTIAFSTCAIPQAVDVLRHRTARHLSPYFLGLWLTGCLASLAFTMQLLPETTPLVVAYLVNGASCVLICIERIAEVTGLRETRQTLETATNACSASI